MDSAYSLVTGPSLLLFFHKTNHYPEDLLSRIPDSRSCVGRPRKILVEAAKTDAAQKPSLLSLSQSSGAFLLLSVDCLRGETDEKDFSFSVGLTGLSRGVGCGNGWQLDWDPGPIPLSVQGPGGQHWHHQGHNKGNGHRMQHTAPSWRNIWQRSYSSALIWATCRLGNSLISAIFSPGKSEPRAVGGITDGGVIPGETKESWREASCESDVGWFMKNLIDKWTMIQHRNMPFLSLHEWVGSLGMQTVTGSVETEEIWEQGY